MGTFDGVELHDLVLSGPRLALRPWRAADAERVHAVMQDRRMHEFLALPWPYRIEAATRFVTELGDEGRAEGTGIGRAVIERATGRVVGSAALRLRPATEIGYWVAPDSWGNAYAAEATQLLTEWAFAHGEQRVELICEVRNLASVRTALASGFGYEGTVRDWVLRPVDDSADARTRDLARFARLATDPGEPIPPAFVALPAGGLGDGTVTLRVVREQDAAELAEIDADELTRASGFGGPLRTAEQHRRDAARAGLDWLVGRTASFAIVDDASARVAGELRLRLAGPPAVGGIGYRVHPDFRGRGYTARALRLVTAWAFTDGAFARLELGAKADNLASQRAAASAGFAADGIRAARLRYPDGAFADEVRFALVNPDIRRR